MTLIQRGARARLTLIVSKKREGEIVTGQFQGLRVEKILLEELANDYLSDFAINDKKSIASAERYARYLKAFFPGKAVDITSDRIMKYVDKRQAEGTENGTINRELSALRMLLIKNSSRRLSTSISCAEGKQCQTGLRVQEYVKLKRPALLLPDLF
jgi:hypothetical protein